MQSVVLLLFVALITFFFIKLWHGEDPSPNSESEYVWVTRKIEEVLVMFPNTDRAALAYALGTSRSVEGCIQALLNGQTLPSPPEDSRYYAWDIQLQGMDLASAKTTRVAAKDDQLPSQDQLIKEYNLQNRTYVS